MVDKILESYGTPMVLTRNDEDFTVKGFLQPERSMSQRSITTEISPLGEIHGDIYLYIGPAGHAVETGDTLLYRGHRYELRQVETVMYRDRPVYIWGLCVRKGGDNSWA